LEEEVKRLEEEKKAIEKKARSRKTGLANVNNEKEKFE